MQATRRAVTALFILALFLLLLLPYAFQYCAEPPVALPVTTDVSEQTMYILFARGDHLALQTMDGTELMTVWIDPRTLPPHDQSMLQSGIPLQDETALEELLQDLGS